MLKRKIEVRRSVAVLILIVVLVGGLVAASAPKWSGTGRVPVYVDTSVRTEAQLPQAGFAPVVKKVLPAVVNISSSKVVREQTGMSPFDDPFFQQFFGNQMWRQFHVPQERREESLGSGVIISPDGYIVTNNHVVDGASKVKVFLPDKREFEGRVIGKDTKTDIAVVKIDATNLPTVVLGDSKKLEIGDYVLAVGDPFGIGETVTMGIVSAKGRGGLDIEDYEDFIQTDAAINPGNSGGALIDSHGDLVGINTAILASNGGGNQGIGFAIPVNMVRHVMDQIIRNGKVVRGWLGASVQEVTPVMAKVFGMNNAGGAVVDEVTPNSPAAGAGLKQGDIITAVNDQPVSGPNELRLRIADMAPGSVAHLQVLRNGQQHSITVKVGTLPDKQERASAEQSGEQSGLAGLHVQTLTPSVAQDLGLPSSTHGVVVTTVSDDSAAADAGLQHGDVIEQVDRQPVRNVGEFERAVSKAGNDAIVLLVNRGGQTSFVTINGA